MSHSELDILISQLSKMPGLGPRSGRRMALHLLNKKETVFKKLIESFQTVYDTIVECTVCHNLDTVSPCHLCNNKNRSPHALCIVESVGDLWAMERSKVYNGYYHILGGVLSAIDGIGPGQLNLTSLIRRVEEQRPLEITVALSATVDGQTTMHYLVQLLKDYNISITTLAQGVPMGGELDYLDDGTLSQAFSARRVLDAA